MPNKQPAKDVIELGNSWKADGDSDSGSVCHNQNIWFTVISEYNKAPSPRKKKQTKKTRWLATDTHMNEAVEPMHSYLATF